MDKDINRLKVVLADSTNSLILTNISVPLKWDELNN